MTILTSKDDNFLYFRLIDLLNQIKLVQGGASIAPTLRRHKVIRDYLLDKQKWILNDLQETYFLNDDLNKTAVFEYHQQKNLIK